MPFQGRTGVVRGKGHLLFWPVWEVWCDKPDLLGRQLVKVHSGGIRPI